jgi:hypothetical protein
MKSNNSKKEQWKAIAQITRMKSYSSDYENEELKLNLRAMKSNSSNREQWRAIARIKSNEEQ